MPRTLSSADLASLAASCDLDAAGAAPAGPAPVDPVRFARLAAAMPPDLGYVARSLDRRLDPFLVMPGARSVVACLVAYAGPSPGIEALPPGHGFVSRFAWCRDYHKTVGPRLRRLAHALESLGGRATWYVDTGPVIEKAWAAAAGLGFIGRNTLLVSPRFGSFVFLGVVLTDLEVEPSVPVPDGCGACTACRDACPTGALRADRTLDPACCLARVTVTAGTPVPADVAPRLAGHLYGCDDCQDACPWNRAAERPDRPEFRPLPGLHAPALHDVLALDEPGFASRFGTTPVRRRGLNGLNEVARLLEVRRPG